MELTNREAKILKLFSDKMDLVHLDQIKLVFGWRLFIADLKKLIFMYGFALLMGCFIETLLIHVSFFTFRQVAFGAHSKNFYICLVISCIIFPVSAVLLKGLEFSMMHIWIAYFIGALPLLLFAPIGTSVNAIRGTAHAQYLKKRIYIRLSIFAVVLLFLPIAIAKFLVAGLLVETITIMISIIHKGD